MRSTQVKSTVNLLLSEENNKRDNINELLNNIKIDEDELKNKNARQFRNIKCSGDAITAYS